MRADINDLRHIRRRRRRRGRRLLKSVFLLHFTISHLFGANYTVCLLVLKLAPAKHATNAFNSKQKFEKLSRCGSRSPNNAEFGHFTLLFCRGRQRSVPRFYNASAQSLFCWVTLLFDDVLVAVVFCIRSLLFCWGQQRNVPRLITHVDSHCTAHYIFCPVTFPRRSRCRRGFLRGPLTDNLKPLLKKIYSHITLSFLVSSEYFICFNIVMIS